jgi:hypothetical protein
MEDRQCVTVHLFFDTTAELQETEPLVPINDPHPNNLADRLETCYLSLKSFIIISFCNSLLDLKILE